MLSISGFLFFVFLSFFSFGCGNQVNVWPLPQKSSVGTETVALIQNHFQIVCATDSGVCSSLLQKAFKRYEKYIFFANSNNNSNVPPKDQKFTLYVRVKSSSPLQLGVDESYTLSVQKVEGNLTATTEWGALRGLETFSQFVEWSPESGYSINILPIMIEDEPRFPWRGLMIDTARHYLPVSIIKGAIDALSFNKMNTLHWHVTDSQSFPLVSKVYPLLSEKGSWRSNAIYTQEQVKEIIEYAKERGVRVVAEFDTPGHADCWGNGYPELFPSCNVARPAFDPTKSYTKNFMKNFLQEMMKLFEDSFIHLGGDEVSPSCWEQDPAIKQWMKENNIPSYSALQGYYEKTLENIVIGQNKNSVFWDEVFGDKTFPLDKSSVVQVWNKPQSEVINVTRAGYRVLYSSSWYLDRQVPDPKTYYLWEDTWKDFYAADPIGDYKLTPDELKRVLGGEACMWGEQVDATDFDVRVWPRAAAIGERLWSAQSVRDIETATPRLGTQRCRMVRRGIMAGPIYPDYCDTGKN